MHPSQECAPRCPPGRKQRLTRANCRRAPRIWQGDCSAAPDAWFRWSGASARKRFKPSALDERQEPALERLAPGDVRDFSDQLTGIKNRKTTPCKVENNR